MKNWLLGFVLLATLVTLLIMGCIGGSKEKSEEPSNVQQTQQTQTENQVQIQTQTQEQQEQIQTPQVQEQPENVPEEQNEMTQNQNEEQQYSQPSEEQYSKPTEYKPVEEDNPCKEYKDPAERHRCEKQLQQSTH